MAVKIRLKRMGKKKQPTYRVVVADSRAPRDGRIIERLGRYDPRQEPSLVEIDNERAQYWLSTGAQPTDRVRKLLEISGAVARAKVSRSGVYRLDDDPPPASPPPEPAPAEEPAVAEETPAGTETAENAAAEEPPAGAVGEEPVQSPEDAVSEEQSPAPVAAEAEGETESGTEAGAGEETPVAAVEEAEAPPAEPAAGEETEEKEGQPS